MNAAVHPAHRRIQQSNDIQAHYDAQKAAVDAERHDHPTVVLPAEHIIELADAFGVAVVNSIDRHIGALVVSLDGRGVHLVSEGPVRGGAL